MKILLIVLILAVSASAYQSAKVIHLKPADQVEAKKLWNELQAAQKAWNDFEHKIADQYTKEKETIRFDSYKSLEWRSGILFSEDFSVIVPKSPTTPSGAYFYTPNGAIFTPNNK